MSRFVPWKDYFGSHVEKAWKREGGRGRETNKEGNIIRPGTKILSACHQRSSGGKEVMHLRYI